MKPDPKIHSSPQETHAKDLIFCRASINFSYFILLVRHHKRQRRSVVVSNSNYKVASSMTTLDIMFTLDTRYKACPWEKHLALLSQLAALLFSE